MVDLVRRKRIFQVQGGGKMSVEQKVALEAKKTEETVRVQPFLVASDKSRFLGKETIISPVNMWSYTLR